MTNETVIYCFEDGPKVYTAGDQLTALSFPSHHEALLWVNQMHRILVQSYQQRIYAVAGSVGGHDTPTKDASD